MGGVRRPGACRGVIDFMLDLGVMIDGMGLKDGEKIPVLVSCLLCYKQNGFVSWGSICIYTEGMWLYVQFQTRYHRELLESRSLQRLP